MGLMTDFQRQKKADPSHGAPQDGGYGVVGSMPTSTIGKQQATAELERELESDLAALKMIKSIKEKERVKAETLIPKYMPLVNTLQVTGSDHPLLGQILVWLFDTGDIPGAMELAVYCIGHKVPMPEWFKRDLPTFLCDTVIEWAEGEFDEGRTCEPYFTDVFELAHTDDSLWDLPDQVRAKFYRLRGMIASKAEDWKQAVIDLEYAKEYGAKVKTLLDKANKKLQDLPKEADPE